MKLLSFFEPLTISWIESLTFFRPSTLKLFLLVTLKSVRELYRALGHAWSFVREFAKPRRLILLVLLLSYLIGQWTQKPPPGLGEFLVLFFGALVVTLLLKGTRPSIEYKGHRYWRADMIADLKVGSLLFFLAYIPYAYLYGRQLNPMEFLLAIIYALLPIKEHKGKHNSWKEWALVIALIVGITFVYWIGMNTIPSYADTPSIVKKIHNAYLWLLRLLFIDEYYLGPILGPFAYFLSPFVLLTILFMLDAQRTGKEYCKAILRALTMFVYNYPFFAIVYTLCVVSVILIHALGLSLPLQVLLFVMVGLPLYICFITNFYLKRVHEQFLLYYE